MDINSLLSPTGALQAKKSPPMHSPSKPRRSNTGSSQVVTPSPLIQSTLPPTNVSTHALSQISSARASPGRSPVVGPVTDTPTSDVGSSRVSSTPSMDALAEIASMQNHQPPRSAAPLLRRSTESFENQRSPSTMFPTVQTSNTINPRSSIDFAMNDNLKSNIRTDFSDTSLSPARQQRASSLVNYLQENPYSFESHAELVKLLHDAFMEHIYPPDSPEAHGDPYTFDLIGVLRSARENMDKVFAIGEELWADWIQDESMVARTTEERIAVMEKCAKAVEEEYGSTRLWITYGDWVLYSYNLVQGSPSSAGAAELSEEDRLVGREIFTWQMIIDVWSKGAEETLWRINDSHLVWNRYIELMIQDLARSPSQEGILTIKSLFDTRLKMPHANWDSTFEIFSTFITTYMNDQYEEIMMSTTRNAVDAKALTAVREEFEFNLTKAQESGDRAAEYSLWAQYIEWEATPTRKKTQVFELHNALYERAELRFPSDPSLWEDHIVELLCANKSTMSLVARSTRHCPWSGSLWSQYLLTSDREGLSFPETEEIKHKATNTGVLDVGGMEEVLKVHTAWCNYLRRRAFRMDASDEDLDVAEMGIRSSIETIQELGTKRYGKDYQGDPYFRLERVYVNFLSESGSWDSARETFRGLIQRCGSSWEFWMDWYHWEMVCWAKFTQNENGPVDESQKTTAPHYATAVLKQGIERSDVDWPERLIQHYMTHCEDFEDAETLQSAMALARVAQKKIANRRQHEAAAAAKAEKSQTSQVTTDHSTPGQNASHTGKRKRDDEAQTEIEEPMKKTRSEDVDMALSEPPNAKEKQLKRDRENSTILVENLPGDVTEVKVRQFFRDCGTINTLKVIRSRPEEATAVIEFDEHDAALAAQTRDRRDLDGHTISVQLGSGSTIFVSNFPPAADESYIRDMFNKFGEILDIRFPSLKYNTHRRFCYVQFKLNVEAQAATELDGHEVGDGLRLVAKISNPLNKQERSGAMEEGREIYIRNIDWNVTEYELSLLFQKYGNVETSRIVRDVGGKSKGFGYVVFSSKVEANAALEMNDHIVKNRKIHVEISSKTGPKRQATGIINRVDRTESPPIDQNGAKSAASPSPMSPASTGSHTIHTTGDRQSRTLALMNVPDTVNDARIRAITEPYGGLIKISLRPAHQGAIVEYIDASAAGKASLSLEGYEIAPGRQLHIGTVPELLKQSPEQKTDKIQVGRQKRDESTSKPSTSSTTLQPGVPIRRPGQPGTGRRGGLGVKRGGLGTAAPGPGHAPKASNGEHEDQAKHGANGTEASVEDGNSSTAGGGGGVGKKNNDDFRAMLEGKR